jgi:hypothetical protein
MKIPPRWEVYRVPKVPKLLLALLALPNPAFQGKFRMALLRDKTTKSNLRGNYS